MYQIINNNNIINNIYIYKYILKYVNCILYILNINLYI